MKVRIQSRHLAIIIVLGSMGGTASVPIGYAGRLLSGVPVISSIGGQFISGLHIFWLVLAALMVYPKFSGSMTGAIKGLVEVLLFSHIGIFALLLSVAEGVVVDIVFGIAKKSNFFMPYIAGGLASASNVIVLRFLLLPEIPAEIFLAMYLSSFFSGLIFGGYLVKQVLRVFGIRAPLENRSQKCFG